ncbi:DUF1702 family protein [Streptomyces sp. ST2-7A]|uniref:DUF1702 family protein n=1 Tax=Streptomyces sp. ST2-7A TaxID=2907214 RepID=UPI001F457B3E|nr:DUF1702 family protein [Streptomyces sp. ST2-7A]MCE7079499.1 DUF1702 family protein [Streptomyces sp. ST2-7A]
MAGIPGAALRLAMAPSLDRVSFAARGFPGATASAARHLETIPQTVVCGFEWGLETKTVAETERRLEMIAPEVRGFAYEGATMACVIRDAMRPGGKRTLELLTGAGRPHIFLNYIGIGFAMARLPRPLWRRVVPRPTDPELYPQMNWLAVDGYGFDRAYFDTRKWIEGQYRPRPHPWEGDREYFPRAVDQGVGRALWFVYGGRTDDVAAAVRRFAHDRRADLWSGVGLAATFAGGTDGAGPERLRAEAGEHAGHLAQGAVFALKARHRSGHIPSYTRATGRVLTGLDAEAAVELADAGAPAPGIGASGGVPGYERWRIAVRERLTEFPAPSK